MSEPDDELTAPDSLPPGFYDRVAPFLHICGMGCLQFFSRPDDPLPQEITALTGLDLDSVRLITGINSNETLAQQLLTDPALLYVHLLVGSLVLEGPLAEPVMRFLQGHGHFDPAELEELRAHLLPFGVPFVELVGTLAANDDEDAQAELHLLRLQIEGAFARLSDTLQPVEVPVPGAHTAVADSDEDAEDAADDAEDPDDDWEDEDDEYIFEIRFREEQLHMLRLSLLLTRMLRHYPELPFAVAATQLTGCPLAAIDELTPRLQEATSAERLPLSWADVALLYQSTQVLAMVLVSPLLETLQLVGPLRDDPAKDARRAEETAQALVPQTEEEEAMTQDERFQRRQELLCLMISGFVTCIQDNFTDESRLPELRTEVEALADLL